jgi:hypothetical protein
MTTLQTLLTGGGLAALGGLLSGLITNWLGDRRDQRKYGHERVMALDARRQDRLEQAYIELLAFLAHHAAWAKSVQPKLGPIEAPDPLPRQEVWRVDALVEAHGSPEVRGLMREWRMHAGKLADADITIKMMQERMDELGMNQQLQDQWLREQEAIPTYRKTLFDTAKAIREQVRRELAGEA